MSDKIKLKSCGQEQNQYDELSKAEKMLFGNNHFIIIYYYYYYILFTFDMFTVTLDWAWVYQYVDSDTFSLFFCLKCISFFFLWKRSPHATYIVCCKNKMWPECDGGWSRLLPLCSDRVQTIIHESRNKNKQTNKKVSTTIRRNKH